MTANPNATPETQRVLAWLTALPDRADKRVISGQHAGTWNYTSQYDARITAIYEETGKWIAMAGADYAWSDWSEEGQNSKLIEHWNNGGLIYVGCHWYNPWTGNGLDWTGGQFWDQSMNGGDFSNVYTPGNAAYDMFHADMDVKAAWLSDLQSNGVVVVFRIFHEMNDPWFAWWSGRDQTKFVTLWQYVFDYFTTTKGLNNLIWVYAPSAEIEGFQPAEYYYPGSDYVDIAGLDYYLYTNDMNDIGTRGYPEILSLGKPFAITEFGPSGWLAGDPNPELHPQNPDWFEYDVLIQEIRDECPKATYFLAWSANWAIANQLNAQELLDDSWVITRDEVDWRSGPIPDEIIIDDTDAGFSTSFSQDAWRQYTKGEGQHYGNSHYYNRKIGSGQDTATWSFTVPEPGNYDVYAWWWEKHYRPGDVPYTVNHFHGSTTVRMDQRANGGQWNLLGTFYWHDEGSVVVSDDVSSGRDIVADAIRLVYRSEGEKKTLQEELVALRAKLEALDVVDVTAMLVHVDNALARLEELEAAKEETLGIE